MKQKKSLGAVFAAFFGAERPAGSSRVDPLHVAAAAVLLEAARADDAFDEAERGHVESVLRGMFGLSAGEIEMLLDHAGSQRDHNPDLWRFTHEINKRCSKREKLQLMEDVWRIVFSDGVLGRHEDQLAHKLGRLLNLDHPELIQCKMKARN